MRKNSLSNNTHINKWKTYIPFRLDGANAMYALAALFFIIAIILIVRSQHQSPHFVIIDEPLSEETDTESIPENCAYRRYLDGVCVDFADQQASDYIAVMVENHIDARPQAGISQAKIVYEAPVEGNINRFLLLFDTTQTVEKVGPVRSARPYYLDWLAEFGEPMYMHVGGSPEALDRIVAEDVFDMNEFFRGWYYWRSQDRYAPHNAYTSSELWQAAFAQYADGRVMSTATWAYEEQAPCEVDCITAIDVAYRAPYYAAHWQYRTSTNDYLRHQLDRPHVDDDGSQITANTVVIQYVYAQVIDEVGRLRVQTIGEGEATVFVAGKELAGRWEKDSRTKKTRFLTNDGKEIPFVAGKTWITIVPQTGLVEAE